MTDVQVAALAPGYEPVLELVRDLMDRDPSWRFQLAVEDAGGTVMDLWCGDGYSPEAIHAQASTTKGIAGITIALLVERGLLDVERPLADIWPEFGAAGKRGITVAEALSHQAGLVGFSRPFTMTEAGEGRAAAADLAAQRPRWASGKAHGYHSLTIGVLADEIVFRLTGRPLWEYYQTELAEPAGVEYWIRLPESQQHRVVRIDVPDAVPGPRTGSLADEANDLLNSLGESNRWLNSVELRSAGVASVSGVGSARGLARAYAAAALGGPGTGPALSPRTLETVSLLRTAGPDLVLGSETRFAVLFQKPHPGLDFGTARALGHDGAGGALGFADPATGIAFGYTTQQAPVPGGADRRALLIARAIRALRLQDLQSPTKANP